MNPYRRLANHYTRWNLESSVEEQFSKFKNRVIAVFNDVVEQLLVQQPKIDDKFYQLFQEHRAEEPIVKRSKPIQRIDSPVAIALQGTKKLVDTMRPYEFTEEGFGDTRVYKAIKSASTFSELITILQIFFWILEEEVKDLRCQRELAKKLKDAAKLTPLMQFNMVVRGRTVVFYPVGEEFLDQGTIDYVITGLEKYPTVAKHFELALTFYQNGDVSMYRNLLDNLRFAIEQLLKQILNNNKSLENQKEILLPWLRGKELHPHAIGMYEALLFGRYKLYQNEAVKHNEAFSIDEVEFMIYLTGTLMRLILQLADKDT